jgi:hypothetical protein
MFATHSMTRELAPRARFELATLRLTAECSTIELPGNGTAGPHSITAKRRNQTSATVRNSLRRRGAILKPIAYSRCRLGAVLPRGIQLRAQVIDFHA